MTRFSRAWREAAGIVACAIAIGLAYTYVQGKGLFAATEQSPETVATVPAPGLIHIGDALSYFESGRAVFVDSRHAFDYRLGHIRGAVNVPLADFDSHQELIRTLPRDKMLITYCDGAQCNSSVELAVKLLQAGFPSVKVFFAGWQEWQSQHLPTEASP